MTRTDIPKQGPTVVSSVSAQSVEDVLDALFANRPTPLVLVSGYDQSIMYGNRAIARGTLPVDWVGRSLQELCDLYGIDVEESPTALALKTKQMHARQWDDDGHWIIASLLPTDDISDVALCSDHATPDKQTAIQQHIVVASQAIIALEMRAAEKMMAMGLEMMTAAQHRITKLRGTLLASDYTDHFNEITS